VLEDAEEREVVKHRDLIDRIEDAADAARTALIEGDALAALAAAHLVNRLATELTRALYDDESQHRMSDPRPGSPEPWGDCLIASAP
jgi:hypothetical protein